MDDTYTLRGRFSLEPPAGTSPMRVKELLEPHTTCWKVVSKGKKLVAATSYVEGTEFMNELDRLNEVLRDAGWRLVGAAQWEGSDPTDRGEIRAAGGELEFHPEPMSMLTDEAMDALERRAAGDDVLERDHARAWLSLARGRTTRAALAVSGVSGQ